MKHKYNLLQYGVWIILIGLLGSCTPTQNLVYLQEKEGKPSPPDRVHKEYTLKNGDMVYINIKSAAFTQQAELFQRQRRSNIRSTGNTIGSPSIYLTSYRISDSGYVRMPVMGKLKLAGLTLAEANTKVQDRANNFLKEGIARVRLVNFNVSIFGEVKRPGTYQIYRKNLNMLELISHAGDVTPYANRQKIMVIREQAAKQDTTIFLDLTDRRVLQSPYFYLKPGDQVYVKPYLLSKTTGFATIPWGTIFSAISSTILIINFLN